MFCLLQFYVNFLADFEHKWVSILFKIHCKYCWLSVIVHVYRNGCSNCYNVYVGADFHLSSWLTYCILGNFCMLLSFIYFVCSILYVKIKKKLENLNNQKFYTNLHLTTCQWIFLASLAFYHSIIFEWLMQNPISISPSITTEAKIAHKPGDRTPFIAAGYLDHG